jgi:hypothetical protein
MLLQAPPVPAASPAPTTAQVSETVTAAAPTTQKRRRWPLFVAPLVVLLLAACALLAYQLRHTPVQSAQVNNAPANDNTTTQPTQPPTSNQSQTSAPAEPTAAPTHQPTPNATTTPNHNKPPAETNTNDEQRARAEEQRAEQERQRQQQEPQPAPTPPPTPDPTLERAAAEARMQAQIEAARADFERARIDAATAQRELQQTRGAYRRGATTQAAVDAATQRMYQTGMELAKANSRLQSLMAAKHALEGRPIQSNPNNLPRRMRRGMNGQPPP